MTDREVLEMFMNYDLSSAKDVFDKFMTLDNAQYYKYQGRPSCVYVPGTRPDRVLLVAHADTVFYLRGEHKIIHDKAQDIYKSGELGKGMGADDRAGCAILWLLKDSGHSLLVTNDEELGSLGSHDIRDFHKKLFEEINGHSYILEFDRRHGSDYKVYDIPVTEEFKKFIEENTSYREADKRSSTDIRVLCEKICGANLSVGYYKEHRPEEYLVFSEWKNTLDVARKMLEPEQKKFSLDTRTILKHVFYDTAAFCHEDSILSEAVKFGLAHTEVYQAKDYPVLPVIPEKAGVVSVTKERTFEAAMRLHREAPDNKIAVLNFAAATRPGGGVKNGAKAQEECLCRCSTLMSVLEQEKTMKEFYTPNQLAHNPLHNDSCIYSPRVIICKSDTDIPERLNPEDFVTVDVISCAAPNLGNPHLRRKPSDTKLFNMHVSRAKHILHIAALHGVDILVIGAFGCGAFKNPPLMVAEAWKSALVEYKARFDKVVFAIYSKGSGVQENKNYLVFNAIMKI